MLPVVTVKNLPGTVNRSSLANLFVEFGTVVYAKIFVDEITGRSKGEGEVRFETYDSASRLIQAGGVDCGSAKCSVSQVEN